MDLLLHGERALVTGVASNIGLAIARRLIKEGAAVLGVDIARDPESLAEDRRSGSIDYFACDLTDPGAHLAVMSEAKKRLGCPSILVHSAAPARREADHVLTVSEEVFDRMIDVNVRAGFFLARALCHEMKSNNIAGRLLFITSLHASVPRNLPHYSAAKAAQTMLVKELARAFGPAGIRVNAIAPGAIPGGGVNITPEVEKRLAGMIPMRRPGQPEDVAATAVAMVCDQFTGYVTGCTLPVDGGLALHSWIPDPY
jgi:NAD(P)-dependent dehydrogenase (short-subunit alcohol dehydrogenase family)